MPTQYAFNRLEELRPSQPEPDIIVALASSSVARAESQVVTVVDLGLVSEEVSFTAVAYVSEAGIPVSHINTFDIPKPLVLLHRTPVAVRNDLPTLYAINSPELEQVLDGAVFGYSASAVKNATKQEAYVDTPKLDFKTTFKTDIYKPATFIPPSNGTLSHPVGEAVYGAGLKLKWDGNIPAPESWAIWIGTQPLQRDLESREVPLTPAVGGKYVYDLSGYTLTGDDFYVTLYAVNAGVPTYVDFRKFHFDTLNSISLVSHPLDTVKILDDDEVLQFRAMPTVADTFTMSATDNTGTVLATDATLLPDSNYQFSNLDSTLTSVSIRATLKLTGDPDSEYYTEFTRQYDPFAPVTLLPITLTGNSGIVQWVSPGWSDDLSWDIAAGTPANPTSAVNLTGLPAGARQVSGINFRPEQGPLVLTVTWTREGNQPQSIVGAVDSPSLGLTKASEGTTLGGITEVVSWTEMPFTDNYKVVATQNGAVLFDSGELVGVTSTTMTNLPLGSPDLITVTLYHTYQGVVTETQKVWAPSSSLFQNDLDKPLLGNALLLKWLPISGDHDSLRVYVAGRSGGTELPANATESWVYDIPLNLDPARFHLVSVKADVETIIQTMPLTISNQAPVLTAPALAITSNTTQVAWTRSVQSVAFQKAILLATDNSVIASTGPLSNLDSSALLTGIPDVPNPIRILLSVGFGGAEHGSTFALENTRLFQNLTFPDDAFYADSEQITWDIITLKTLENVNVQVKSKASGLIYYTSGPLAPEIREAPATGLPTDGSDLVVTLYAKAVGDDWVAKEFPVKAYDQALVTPYIVSPNASDTLPVGPNTFRLSTNGLPIAYWRFVMVTNQDDLSNPIYDSGNVPPSTVLFPVPAIGTGAPVYAVITYTDGTIIKKIVKRFTAPLTVPELTTPIIYDSEDFTYTWGTMGAIVTAWRFTAEQGGGEFYDSGVLAAGTYNAFVTGHNVVGLPVTAKLHYQLTDGSWHVVTEINTGFTRRPTLVSPTSGTLLTTDSPLFTWDSNGVVAESWVLKMAGTGDIPEVIYEGIPTGTLQKTLYGITPDGTPRNVWLGFRETVDAPYKMELYTFPTLGSPVFINSYPPVESFTANWDNRGTQVNYYTVRLGSTAGAQDLGISPSLPNARRAFSFFNLPRDGRVMYVTLEWVKVGGTAPSSVSKQVRAQLYAPSIIPVEAPLVGSKIISWQAGGVAVSEWGLEVGTSYGGSDVFSIPTGIPADDTTEAVDLPVIQGTAYYTLHYKRADDGTWHTSEYSHPLVQAPYLIAPSEGTVLAGDKVTVSWGPGTDNKLDRWQVLAGPVAGANTFYDSGELLTFRPHEEVTGLPIDGSEVWVTLRYHDGVADTWDEITARYIAFLKLPEFSNTVLGQNGLIKERLHDFEHTFQWDFFNLPITSFELLMGSTPGADDVYHSAVLSGSATSDTVTGIPSDGRDLYLTLRWTF